ncbi:putative dehydrogenase [Cladorrhinum sp. PSN259]|nr:putative dehydrogenase [Cladorrhinum sp. PSN259]
MPFPYKTILITGATSGIGLALAERIINHNDDTFVIAVGRRQDRLEALVAKHGADKVAAEPFDVSDLEGLPAWVNKITTTYPTLDCIVLNAGFQRSVDFTSPDSISLPRITAELTTNYLSPVHTLSLFLPHLISRSPNPACIVLVSSGLSVLPLPRCANYCATKAAVHSLAWSLRCQMEGNEKTKHVRVVEVVPPAVKTELHTQQEDLVRQGLDMPGIELDKYIEETWSALREGELDEIMYSGLREIVGGVEEERKKRWVGFVEAMRKAGLKF